MLPDDLRAALESMLGDVPRRGLTTAVRGLSERYREHRPDAAFPLLHSDVEAMAYLAYRLPATFATVSAVLREVRLRQSELEPESLLDVGSGPGTAAWAAVGVWPSLRRMMLVERDPRMIQTGRRLAEGAEGAALRDAEWRRADISDLEANPFGLEADRFGPVVYPADIVVASYVLGELPGTEQDAAVRGLWQKTLGSLVLVEPGTPQGFRRVRRASEALTSAGAHVIAPAPHEWRCVESEDDWCHFSARVVRTRLHRTAKDVSMGYEDEKYAYVVASRVPGRAIAGRVIRRPQIHTGHVRLVVCTARGVQHMVVSRKQREAYRRARDFQWGSAIESEEAEMFGLR